jgi:hypothetical protein
LKKLINFKINYADSLNRAGVYNWAFWYEKFSGCTNLESADISFELPDTIDGFCANLKDLFKGCSNLSYIKVNSLTAGYMSGFSTNDWLDVEKLPLSGTLILPSKVYLDSGEEKPDVVTSADKIDSAFLSYDRVKKLLDKKWTIKLED